MLQVREHSRGVFELGTKNASRMAWSDYKARTFDDLDVPVGDAYYNLRLTEHVNLIDEKQLPPLQQRAVQAAIRAAKRHQRIVRTRRKV